MVEKVEVREEVEQRKEFKGRRGSERHQELSESTIDRLINKRIVDK